MEEMEMKKQQKDGSKEEEFDAEEQQQASLCQKLRFALTPNRKLLPLKLTIFFYSCSAFSIIPYLTIHMKVEE